MTLALQIVQTTAVVAALLFTGWQFRAQVRAQRYRNYFDAISVFVDLSKMMIEKPELHVLYQHSLQDLEKKLYEEMTPDEKTLIHYCDTIIALCETVWYASEEKRVRKDEWRYWRRWLQDLSASPYFRWTLDRVEGEYDTRFLAELRGAGSFSSRRTPAT